MDLRIHIGGFTTSETTEYKESMLVIEELLTVITGPVHCAIFTDFYSSMSPTSWLFYKLLKFLKLKSQTSRQLILCPRASWCSPFDGKEERS